jgi:protein gp37
MLWQRRADQFEAVHGRRQRVFCASLADVFDNKADPIWRADLFQIIKETPRLDWQLLTKRPQNIEKMLPDDWSSEKYPNVWLGFTAEDQERFDQRVEFIQIVEAAIWFVSYEPAIGPLRLSADRPRPDWLIIGGESGHGARVMRAAWARNVISDCEQLGVAPFLKQWGDYRSNPLVQESGLSVDEVKKLDTDGKGGGLLDDRIVREFPLRALRVHAAA